MKTRSGLLVLTLCFTIITSDNLKPRLACVFVNNAYERNNIGFFNTEKIPVDKCTHVIYSSIGINDQNWIIRIKNYNVDILADGLQNITNLKTQNPNVKYLISIRDETKVFSDMANEKSRRDTLINNIVEFINYYSFDGVDLHWEFPGETYESNRKEDKLNYLYFIQELRRVFTKENKNWEITMLVPIYQVYVSDGFYMYELCKELDAVHLKGFDLRALLSYTDVLSPLYKSLRHKTDKKDILNLDEHTKIWTVSGCPTEKVVLGMTFYGRQYTLLNNTKFGLGADATAKGDVGPYTGYTNLLSYYEICSFIQRSESPWIRQWDNEGKVPYAYHKNQWVGYEDKESIQLKVDWLKTKGYGGAFVYSLDYDDFKSLCGTEFPLLNTIYTGLQSYSVPISAPSLTSRPPWLRAPSTPPTK